MIVCANHVVGQVRAAILVREPGQEPRPLCADCAIERGPDHTYSVSQRIDGVCGHTRCNACRLTDVCCRCSL